MGMGKRKQVGYKEENFLKLSDSYNVGGEARS